MSAEMSEVLALAQEGRFLEVAGFVLAQELPGGAAAVSPEMEWHFSRQFTRPASVTLGGIVFDTYPHAYDSLQCATFFVQGGETVRSISVNAESEQYLAQDPVASRIIKMFSRVFEAHEHRLCAGILLPSRFERVGTSTEFVISGRRSRSHI